MEVSHVSICISISSALFIFHNKSDYIVKTDYPVDAVKYIKDNIDISTMRIFNNYNLGSYLMLENIPVFVDSRADLYTKPFSGLDYDILDDWYYAPRNYTKSFEFYGITHVLLGKYDKNFIATLTIDSDYSILYQDSQFVLFKRSVPNKISN